MPGYTAAYGTWPSPISATMLVGNAVNIAEVIPDGDSVWWAESRPSEGGRTALMRWQHGRSIEMTPADANVRTTVHEYGGAAWWVADGTAWYVDYNDQRLRLLKPNEPVVILSAPASPVLAMRYADVRPTPSGQWLVGIGESHTDDGKEPRNFIVALSAQASEPVPATDDRSHIELISGTDFYMSPRISPDGKQIAWVQWAHPNMPWDDTELWVANLTTGDTQISVSDARLVAGGGNESIVQPEWSPDGRLHFLSDRNDLWHLYVEGEKQPVLSVAGEIGGPAWVFGLSRYGFLDDGTVVAAHQQGGIDHLDNYPQYTSFQSVRTAGSHIGFAASSWSAETAVYFDKKLVRAPRDLGLDAAYLPAPEIIDFATGDPALAEHAHALYFAPASATHHAAPGQKPPLIVMAHGGPTASARSQLSLAIRFWTSRGFAVVDVNYRGSSGFGRAYRQKLNGQWGIADVEDCVAVAQFLVKRGDVDESRLIIRGGSAGGFTVLSALAFHSTFTAGASQYGVADLEALATDTHKFESRYLDSLIGPWPEAKSIYKARSPIHHVQGFTAPMIVLQGSDDAIVPPSQSRMIVDALKKSGIAVAYLEFEGEQHGFRRADNIIRALEAELAFYGHVFRFRPAGEPIDLTIING